MRKNVRILPVRPAIAEWRTEDLLRWLHLWTSRRTVYFNGMSYRYPHGLDKAHIITELLEERFNDGRAENA